MGEVRTVDYYSNGCLQLWDAEGGAILGRKDAFSPLNVFVNPEGFQAIIDERRGKATERAAAPSRKAEPREDIQ